MVETITPVVHGDSRLRYAASVGLHVLGTTVAAACVGAALGAVGWLLGAPWGAAGPIAVAVVAALYAGREAFGLPVPVPDAHQQVPEWWRTFFSPPTTSLLYGLGLGVGFLTFLRFGTYVAVSAAALVSGSPLVGVALCAPFGLARGVSVAVSSRTGDAETATELLVGHLEKLSFSDVPRRINALALGSVCAVTIAVLLIGQPGSCLLC